MGMHGLFRFLTDWLLTSIIYGLTFFCVILFYQLNSKEPVELLYPMTIGVTGYGLIMVFEGVKYIRFYRRLNQSIQNPRYQLCPTTQLQMKASEVIQIIHKTYIQEINEIQMNNEQNNRFLSQWVHNLKAPITVVDLLAQQGMEALQRKIEEESKEQQKWAEPQTEPRVLNQYETFVSIYEENKILNHRVEQLLNIIRLGEFNKDYVPETLNLTEEVRFLVNNLKRQFVMNHVFPEMKIEIDDASVFSDRKWNRVMIEQFLTNAIKYSKSNENKKVLITLTRNLNQIVLMIRDFGIGIPDYDLARIFEPFFTGDNGRENNNATGIGLYMADLIAQKLNHFIEVTSIIGQGTTVKIIYNLSKL